LLVMMLLGATQAAFGGSPQTTCFTPEAGTAVRKSILDTLRAGDHNPMGVPVYKVNVMRVCRGWVYVDASPCYGRKSTECAEGGWTLLRQHHRIWKLLPTPKKEACDPMNGTFASPGDECVKILKARYPDLLIELFKSR
jgi:hypothetical protein